MSSRDYTLSFLAAGSLLLPNGRFFRITSATNPVTIRTRGNAGSPAEFTNCSAGFTFKGAERDAWQLLEVTSASIQNVVVVISDDSEVELASQVSIAGTVTMVESPSAALASPAGVAVLTAAASTIAANAARKRITICNPSTSGGSLYVQAVGAGASRGIELQSGFSVEMKTTAAIDVRNDSGVTITYSTLEET